MRSRLEALVRDLFLVLACSRSHAVEGGLEPVRATDAPGLFAIDVAVVPDHQRFERAVAGISDFRSMRLAVDESLFGEKRTVVVPHACESDLATFLVVGDPLDPTVRMP